MFFRNNKLLTVLTLFLGLLGYETSFADSQDNSQTSANQLQETKPPETKVVGRDENKTTNYSKHIKT